MYTTAWRGLGVVITIGVFACGGDTSSGNQNTADQNNNNQMLLVCGNGVVEGLEECDEGTGNSDTVTDACRTDCTTAHCGDGVTDTTELCDDGPANSNVVPDACRADCTPADCGDGVVDVESGELCDDGNSIAGDGCSPICLVEFCGNGVVETGEVCDDGNYLAGDNCTPDCQSDETCGNGYLDGAVGEACDDGNNLDGDDCQADCTLPSCGDGVLDDGEECDDGGNVSGDGCNRFCTSDETCGNSVVDVAVGEECDDGDNTSGDGCQADCRLPVCGDDTQDTGEECDDGNNVDGDGCNQYCSSDESCGNGIVDSVVGEACDDGNIVDGDGCQSDCTLPGCGDGTQDASEMCDDGNNVDGDGCNRYCTSDESCGNGVLDIITGEACDDGNNVPGDGCQANCGLPRCGDGTQDASEMCDDGNNVSGDGCNAWCTSNETCGNGVVDTLAAEQCDDGALVPGDGCGTTCQLEVCGNGIVDPLEVCDDDNTLWGDGCSGDCLSNETCGNSYLDVAQGEACDLGGANSNLADAPCRTDCQLQRCGDGVIDTGEMCDDGDTANGDGCNQFCSSDETCGNGVVDVTANPPEECDDSNTSDGDGCSAVCLVEYCGNGAVEAQEACDDGGNQSGDGCSADCQSAETCGNSYVDVAIGEQCDCGDGSGPLPTGCPEPNGNTATATCRPSCQLPGCGDGLILYPEECEGADLDGAQCIDVGFYGGTLQCDPACQFDTTQCLGHCGDGAVNGTEICDGAIELGDGCLDFGYDAGPLECNNICTPIFADCFFLGWREVDSPHPAFTGIWAASEDVLFTSASTNDRLMTYDGSTWTGHLPGFTGAMYATWGASETDVFAVGVVTKWPDTGTAIYHYDGTTWTAMDPGMAWSPMRSVWGTSGSNVYAVGDGGIIIHYNGTAWTVMASGTTENLTSIWGTAAGDIFAVGAAGTILHFNGASWVPMASPTTNDLTGVSGNSASDVFVVGSPAFLHYDGTTWSALPVPALIPLNAVVGDGVGGAYIGGWLGNLFYYDGTTYHTIDSGTTNHFAGFSRLSDGTILAVTASPGVVLKYIGVGWAADMTSGTTGNLRGMWGTSSIDLWVAESGAAWHFDGSAWTNNMFPGITQDIWGSASNDVIAVGGEVESPPGLNNARIRHFNGTTWSDMSPPTTPESFLNSVWGTTWNNVYAVGRAGSAPNEFALILRYNGTTWLDVSPGEPDELYDIWGRSATDIWAVGMNASILHWNGAVWTRLDPGVPGILTSVWGSSATDVFFTQQYSDAILHWDGSTFTQMQTGAGVGFNVLWGTASDDVLAGGNLGELFHYDGISWWPVRYPNNDAITAVWGQPGNAIFFGTWAGSVDKLYYNTTLTRGP